jgi:hypothetical protein
MKERGERDREREREREREKEEIQFAVANDLRPPRDRRVQYVAEDAVFSSLCQSWEEQEEFVIAQCFRYQV